MAADTQARGEMSSQLMALYIMHGYLIYIDCMLFLLWLSTLNLAFLPTSPPGPALSH
jgi:hypothetical protein